MKFLENRNFLILTIFLFFIVITSIYFFTKDLKTITLNTSEFYTNTSSSEEPIKQKIVIHITGEILQPGIIYLDDNSRIADAIDIAGGCTESADLNKVNLAYELKDGQKIYIPSIYDNETCSYISDNAGANVLDITSEVKSKTININTATSKELETLPGIGASTANKIIEYRTQNGKFRSIEELMNVSGIGENKFNNLKSYISI